MKSAVLIALISFCMVINYANGLSCQWAGNLGCQGSCLLNNCASGSCNSNDVCVCSRCVSGSTSTISTDTCTYGGNLHCQASCLLNNCASGSCNSDRVCVCSRCASGSTILIGKRDDAALARGDSCTYGGILGCSASCASQGKFCGGQCVGPSKTCVCNKC